MGEAPSPGDEAWAHRLQAEKAAELSSLRVSSDGGSRRSRRLRR